MPSRNEEVPLAVEIEETRRLLRIYDGLARSMRDPHAVLDVLLEAEDPAAAATALRERFDLDDVQALAVMDLQYRRATRLDRRNIDERRQELADQLAFLRGLEDR
ncbi:hypothetical protein [Nocardioides mesophilus]|uniref:Uncharacterized protein n=1 Tax=Nocardioides mesophilus TaxID=433659 RepID=A0A7G9RDS1_9ACTN|nr:hypothetical protein [Nocardioides mesophilus]QNN53746.1 hypothetical protein H9L09_04850 [Nocardioides mesophilus]